MEIGRFILQKPYFIYLGGKGNIFRKTKWVMSVIEFKIRLKIKFWNPNKMQYYGKCPKISNTLLSTILA